VTRPPEARPFLSRRATLLFSAVGGLVLGIGVIYVGTEANLLDRAAFVAPRASATATRALTPTPASAPPVASPPGQLAGAGQQPAAAALNPLETGTATAVAVDRARAAAPPAEPAITVLTPSVAVRPEPAKPANRPPKAARQRRRATPPANENMGEIDGRNYRTDL